MSELYMFDHYAGDLNINLGCAKNKITGPGKWVNIDKNRDVDPDVHWDLEFGLPCDSILKSEGISELGWAGVFDLVFASHLMEHIPVEASYQLVSDIYHVLKPGGHFVSVVPHAYSEAGIGIPHHVNHFTESTWGFYIGSCYTQEGSGLGATQGAPIEPWGHHIITLVPYSDFFTLARCDPDEFMRLSRSQMRVVKEIHAVLRKPGGEK